MYECQWTRNNCLHQWHLNWDLFKTAEANKVHAISQDLAQQQERLEMIVANIVRKAMISFKKDMTTINHLRFGWQGGSCISDKLIEKMYGLEDDQLHWGRVIQPNEVEARFYGSFHLRNSNTNVTSSFASHLSKTRLLIINTPEQKHFCRNRILKINMNYLFVTYWNPEYIMHRFQ